MNPEPKSVTDVINDLERQQLHPTRQLAAGLVAEYRRGSAIDPRYDFSNQRPELRQVVYNAMVRFHCKRMWWRRLLSR